MEIAESRAEVVDPRIRRTRQMLHAALERLLGEKSFERISVGEIAEQATLNRATFYDHYTDKSALLEGMVAQRFQELLDRRGVVFDGECPRALMSITLAMCDYLAELPGMACPERRQMMERHFEPALMAVVRRMLLAGLEQHPPTGGVSPELIAATISGAIYAGANEWLRTPQRGTAEEATRSIFQLIRPMLRPEEFPAEAGHHPSA